MISLYQKCFLKFNIDPSFHKGEDFGIRLLVEVFANDRQAAAYAHKEIREKPEFSFFTNDISLVIRGVNTWKMSSAYGTASN